LPGRVPTRQTAIREPYARPMWLRRAIAIVLVLVGLVWFFQGIGVLEGSFMTGEALWAVIGVVCVVGGAALLIRPTRV
jgi:fatty acid desaturase